ncbi:F-box/kelch-repeat protein At3g06240-like [Henckelia pumila]
MRHEVPNDVRFWYTPKKNSLRIDLYNSASDSWKQIHGEKMPDLSYLPGYELFYNGAIQWAIISPGSSPCILCFDLSRESFRGLEFPDSFCSFERDLRLMELDEKLAVVRYQYQMMIEPWCKTEIWVMKQYGVKESWTKQFVMDPHRDICPILFLRNELLSVESDDGQPSALHENQFKGFQFYGDVLAVTSVFYEESLISLNEIITCK